MYSSEQKEKENTEKLKTLLAKEGCHDLSIFESALEVLRKFPDEYIPHKKARIIQDAY